MVKFWAKRIGMDLERIDEAPVRWREDVRQYIIEHTEEG
jgi:hypothetical protein